MNLIAISLMSVALAAQPAAPAGVKAVTPEVQTARWAQSWWMPRHKQKLADMKKQGEVDLLMIGDSITHGWENKGAETWKKYYAPRKAFNLGFSGDRTENVLWRLQHGAIEGISPKLTVIMIGTNNAGHRKDKAEDTAAGIKAIVAEIQKQLPDTKILLLGIFPRGADTNNELRKLNTATNKIIQGYADNKKVFYLNINETFLEDNGVLPRSVMPDLLHPQQKGYGMWAEAMEPTIKKLMDQ